MPINESQIKWDDTPTSKPDYEPFITEAAKTHNVEPELIRAIIDVESSGKPLAKSSKGATGLMQLMKPTALAMGVKDRTDPRQNIMGGTKYLAKQLKATNGDIPLALARYNAGPGNVKKHGGIPPFPETQGYIDKVQGRYNKNKKSSEPIDQAQIKWDQTIKADEVAWNGEQKAKPISKPVEEPEGHYEGWIKPTLNEVWEGVKATPETMLSLANGIALWPAQKIAGVSRILTGDTTEEARETEQQIGETFGYQPKTDAGKGAGEIIGKGFEVALTPARMAGEGITEIVGPKAGYLSELASELFMFSFIHRMGGRVKAEAKARIDKKMEVLTDEQRAEVVNHAKDEIKQRIAKERAATPQRPLDTLARKEESLGAEPPEPTAREIKQTELEEVFKDVPPEAGLTPREQVKSTLDQVRSDAAAKLDGTFKPPEKVPEKPKKPVVEPKPEVVPEVVKPKKVEGTKADVERNELIDTLKKTRPDLDDKVINRIVDSSIKAMEKFIPITKSKKPVESKPDKAVVAEKPELSKDDKAMRDMLKPGTSEFLKKNGLTGGEIEKPRPIKDMSADEIKSEIKAFQSNLDLITDTQKERLNELKQAESAPKTEGKAKEAKAQEGKPFAATEKGDVFRKEMRKKYGKNYLFKLSKKEAKQDNALIKTEREEGLSDYKETYGDKPIVLSNTSRDQGAMIHKSTKKPGGYQLTWWDKRGFSGDTWHKTEAEAFNDAMISGYKLPAPELFNEISNSKKFIEGIEQAEKNQKDHAKTMRRISKELDAEEAAAKEKSESIGPKQPSLGDKSIGKTKKASTKGRKVSENVTLGTYLKRIDGINFGNFKGGELKNMPTAIKRLSRAKGGRGLPLDTAIEDLIHKGYFPKGTDIATVLEEMRIDPNFLKKRPTYGAGSQEATPKHLKTDAEKKFEKDMTKEPESPPEGDYEKVSVDDLKEGETYTIIENRTADGWDEYKIHKTKEGVTLEDGNILKYDPWDKVEVLKKKVSTKQPEWDFGNTELEVQIKKRYPKAKLVGLRRNLGLSKDFKANKYDYELAYLIDKAGEDYRLIDNNGRDSFALPEYIIEDLKKIPEGVQKEQRVEVIEPVKEKGVKKEHRFEKFSDDDFKKDMQFQQDLGDNFNLPDIEANRLKENLLEGYITKEKVQSILAKRVETGNRPELHELTKAEYLELFTNDSSAGWRRMMEKRYDRLKSTPKPVKPKAKPKLAEVEKGFRNPKEIAKDINTALGQKGAIGELGKLTPEQEAAIIRLKGDLDNIKAKAKKRGKTIEKYLIDKKYDPKVAYLLHKHADDIPKYARSININKQDIPEDYKAFEPQLPKQDKQVKSKISIPVLRNVSKGVIDAYKDIKKMGDEYLGSISTRLGNIDPSIKYRLRKFEHNKRQKYIENTKRILPMLEKIKSMSLEDRNTFDLARKNGESKIIQRLMRKYNIYNEYKEVRKVLDELYKEAKSVGYDVGYRKHFHPRIIKDSEGFLNYLQKGDWWPLFDKAIKEKETQLNRYLEIDEKAEVINSVIRGYGPDHIKLAKPGQFKERTVIPLTSELNKFYMSADASLVRYIDKVGDSIEARKLFGKGENINDSIGSYVLDLLSKGKLTPKNEIILRDILNARFNERGTRGVVGMYKNLSYIDTMGSPISAITQVGDLAWALYKSGIPKTVEATIKAIAGKSKIKPKDLGIERIAEEFSEPSKLAKAVGTVFKAVGLEKIDFIGKEALINSTIKKAQSMAKNPKKIGKLRAELEPIFGKETDSLISDLKEGRISENVKLYTFNVLSDFQPITLTEMPQKYLTGGNGRIFYMLKTFTIKQFDVYRREVFQQIKKPGTRIKGVKNLVRLTACFVAANATADTIKSLILNRPLDPEDLAVDNILRLFGISKFVTWKAREEGAGSALVRQIAPPFKFIDAATKDINKIGKGKRLETPSSIPLVGKLYYWWFGKGAEKSERRRKTKPKYKLHGIKPLKLKTNNLGLKSMGIK